MEGRQRTSGASSVPCVSAGWAALQRAEWEEAHTCFEHGLARGESAEALEGLSWAAWWMNDADVVIDARERAYRLFRATQDRRGAARMAIWLASDVLDFRGEPAVAAGWLRRARRVLDDQELCPEHGWLALHEGTIALDLEGDTPLAREFGRRCADIGRTLNVIDLEMLGLALEGQAAVHEGDVTAGMEALDEAAAAAVAGDLEELVSVGWSCCSLIKACEQVRDHDRAAQWSQETIVFAERIRFDPWFGICRSFYASVLVWRGMWSEAERELVAAQKRMAATRPPWAAEAAVRLGELRVCQGRFAEAEQLFLEVDFHPRAQLGLAAIELSRDHAEAAIALSERALRGLPAQEQTGRVPALEMLARGRIAAGDADGARAATDELARLVTAIRTPALQASLTVLRGLLAALEADHCIGRVHFEDAIDLFGRCGAPFDAACARIELAKSLVALGHATLAERELQAALDALSQLDADHHRTRAVTLLENLRRGAVTPGGKRLTARQVEILQLVADGLSDKDMAARLHLSEHTVHRHVSNILAKLAAPSRAAAVAAAAQQNLI